MSQGTARLVRMHQLEAEIAEIFANAPTGLTGNTHLAIPTKPRSLNAMQHGLSGQFVMIGADELLHYAQMGLDYMRDIKPIGALESGAAQLFFEDRWRLHRILKIESDLFSIGPTTKDDPEAHARKLGSARHVNAFREEARNIDLISRYETRLVRNSGRMMDEVRKLRNERAQTNPDLTYDEQTNPAVDWYRRLHARAELLTKARENYELYEAAGKSETAKSNQEKAATSNVTSYGNKSGPEPLVSQKAPKQTPRPHSPPRENAA